MNKLNSHGSSLVETVAILSLLVSLAFWSFSSVSMGLARLWLEHASHEALRCELTGASDCKTKFDLTMNLIGWGHIEDIHITTSQDAKAYKTAHIEAMWCNSKGVNPCPMEKTLNARMQLREHDLKDLRSWVR